MTIWKVIPSFPAYEAADDGQIRRRLPGPRQKTIGIIAPNLERNGYYKATLCMGGRTYRRWVNRLVCEAFHGPAPGPNMHAAHDDGHPSNNHASNLSWKTRLENSADKKRHGTENVGSRNGMSVFTEQDIPKLRELIAALPRSSGAGKRIRKGALSILAEAHGVTASCLRAIKSRHLWSHIP